MPSKMEFQNKSAGLIPRHGTDWLKGLAILMIIVSHYFDFWSQAVSLEGNAKLFCLGMMKLGDYGAALFLMLSGYGLVKSLKGGRVTFRFMGRRLQNVYFPYLIIMGLIDLYNGAFTDLASVGRFLTASSHWFLTVLFILYIAFMILWAVPLPKWLRVITITLFTFAFSSCLYLDGRQDFWFCSNFAFPLGVLIAEYEKETKWICQKAGSVLLPISALMMIPVIISGLGLNGAPISAIKSVQDLLQFTGAQLNFCLLIIFFTSKWPLFDPVIRFVGKISYYLYLTHTFIFVKVVNALECNIGVRFIIAALVTLAVTIICRLVFDFINRKMCLICK